MRAEEAYRDWSTAPPSERPLVNARLVTAKVLFEVMREHDVSRQRLAHMVGIDEKTVRQWLDGSKSIPLAIAHAMPTEMGSELLERLVDARAGGGRSPRRALAALRQSMARIDITKSSEGDRRDLVKQLVEAQARINDLMRWATG